jgi:hypothetical protein
MSFNVLHTNINLSSSSTEHTVTLLFAVEPKVSLAGVIAKINPHVYCTTSRQRISFAVDIGAYNHSETLSYQALRISFDLLDQVVILPHIFNQLYMVGCNVELIVQYIIRLNIRAGSEKHYLFRANPILQELIDASDEPASLPFAKLTRLANELPLQARMSFIHKMASVLFFSNRFKCCTALICLYRNAPCLNALVDDLNQPIIILPDNPDVAIAQAVNAKAFDYSREFKYQISHEFLDDDGRLVNIILTCNDVAMRTKLSATLEANNKVELAGKTYRFGYSEGVIQEKMLVVGLSVNINFNAAHTHELLDLILLNLMRAEWLMEAKQIFELRKGVASVTIQSYVKYAHSVLEQIKTDDPACELFLWIINMSYELPSTQQAEFAQKIAVTMFLKKFYYCAQAMAVPYANDPLCPNMHLTLAIIRTKLTELKATGGNFPQVALENSIAQAPSAITRPRTP